MTGAEAELGGQPQGAEGARTVIAVASGKGGTGKTSIATHLALEASGSNNTLLVDLDVEAPDSFAYFPEAIASGEPERPVTVSVPRLDEAACTGCGLCAKLCRFGAIVAVGGAVVVDEGACKGCGRCVRACPAGALEEVPRRVGTTLRTVAGGLSLLEGRMDVGDIRATAVIESAKARAAEIGAEIEIRDCPPGVSCPATHAVQGADYVVLVTEPTAFSLHDLDAALSLTRELGIDAGVVINKAGFGSADAEAFCEERGVPVLARLAFSRPRAEAGAAARVWKGDKELESTLRGILSTIAGRLSGKEKS